MNDEALMKLINFTIAEITKTTDQCPLIQKPGAETLVALGRTHCQKVLCLNVVSKFLDKYDSTGSDKSFTVK